MKKIYIDAEFKCHTSPDVTFREVETDFFDGKCDTYIEGYRLVPNDEQWISSDGTAFNGEMIAPWKNYTELESAQIAYEREKLAEYESLIDELYAEVTG